MKNIELLPRLTPEEAVNLIKFVQVNYDEANINYDDYCCPEDGVQDGFNLAVKVLQQGYGVE